MSDEQLWRKRFQQFLAVRLLGLATFLLGIAIAFTDLARPGGWKMLGGLLVVMGAVDALLAPRILKRRWDKQDR